MANSGYVLVAVSIAGLDIRKMHSLRGWEMTAYSGDSLLNSFCVVARTDLK